MLSLLPSHAFPSLTFPLFLASLAVYPSLSPPFPPPTLYLASLLAFSSPRPSSSHPLATHLPPPIAPPSPRPSRDVTIVGRHLAIRQPRSSVIVPLYSRIPARLFQPSGQEDSRKDLPARIFLPPAGAPPATSEFAGTQINEITQGFRLPTHFNTLRARTRFSLAVGSPLPLSAWTSLLQRETTDRRKLR